jgi:hypothetical protein
MRELPVHDRRDTAVEVEEVAGTGIALSQAGHPLVGGRNVTEPPEGGCQQRIRLSAALIQSFPDVELALEVPADADHVAQQSEIQRPRVDGVEVDEHVHQLIL